MAERIDELQLLIGSDASKAIQQLGDLASALDKAAGSASGLSGATSALNGLNSALSGIGSATTTRAVENLRELSRIDLKNIKSKKVNIDLNISGVDSFKQMADSATKMGNTNFNDSGVTKFTNSLRRLAGTDMSKFGTGPFKDMVDSVKDLGSLGNVSKDLGNFVSAVARLANAGDATSQTAEGMKQLTPELQNMVTTFQSSGGVEDSVTAFVSAIAKLASAGQKADQSAQGLSKLTPEVIKFLTAMQSAPISDNMAMTIHGLGNLAAAGSNVRKELDSASGSFKSFARQIANTTIDATVKALKGLCDIAIKLGKQGASAIGNFMSKLHLIPSGADGVNRTALSFGNLLRAVLPFYGIRGLFDWAKGAVEAGSSIVELENVIDTSFGHLGKGYEDISGYVYKWAQTTIDGFGVSQLAAERYAGRLMAMFNSSGFDITEGMRDSAAKMSTDLVERAGDIASFYDISVDEAMTKMQSGLAGMTRPLRSLGVNMSVANMQAFALSQGITTAWKEMDQATQMALRYQYMLHATQYAAGDFQKTQLSLANQVRLLTLNFQMLSATIGQGLISAIAPVISWINLLIKRLIQAATAFRTFMWTLFGKPIQAAKGVVDDLAGYLDDASGAAGGLADGAGGASDGLGSAGKAAKELKKQLQVLPFDELNQLAKNTDSASSGSGGGGGGGGAGGGGLGDLGFADMGDLDLSGSPTLDAINKWAQKIRAAFDAKDWKLMGLTIADGLNEGLAKLYEVLDWAKWEPVLKGFIQPFQTVVNFMVDGIDWPLLGKTVARGLNLITNTFRLWINGFNWRNYGRKFALGMNGFLGEWDADAFGRAIVDKFRAAWNFFGGWIEKFNFKLLGTKLKEGVLGALDELDWKDMGNSLAGLFNGISDTIIEFFEDGEVSDKLADSFVELVNGFLEKFDSEKAKKAMESVKKNLQKIISKAISNIDKTELAGDIGNVLIGLPWKLIGVKLGIHVGGALAIGLFGSVFKKTATNLLTNLISSKLGIGAAGKAGASAGAGAASSAGAGAGIGAGGAAGLGIMGGMLGLGLWMRKYADDHGGTEQLKGTNMGLSTQTTIIEKQKENNQALSSKGMNAAGQYTSIQAPTPTNTQSTNTVKTVMTGEKDPSFTLLENAKAALMANPVIKKLMDGNTSKEFNSGYSKYTDTKSYKSTKIFDAKPLAAIKTWWSRNIDTKNYKSTKSFIANPYDSVKTWWSRNVDTKNYKSTKGFAANASDGIKTWWDRNTNTHNYKSTKGFSADPSNGIKTWWGRYVDQGHYTATKYMKAADAGRFLTFTGLWQSIKDKWVDINVSIVKKTADLGAWIKGKWEELVSFRWFAKGGMFTGPTAINVFGEAGDEAAIPLERKSTMKRIGNAIVNAGGMGNSNSDEIADAIALRVIPAIAQMMSNQNQRPIAVNAVLYTENDEVLARAVNRGQRVLDKRYNPVSQFSY